MAPDAVERARGARPRSRTQLQHHPSPAQRYLSLGIVVVATVVLYYQFYLAGAVAAGTDGRNGILVDYHMSFGFYVDIAVVGYLLGALASFATGIADRWGRVNIVTTGLFAVALLCLLGIPLADSERGFAVVFAAIGLVEGMILVATPALVRDFCPQLGRASAMGLWTLGPVLGSLLVSVQVSNTSVRTPWHQQYVAAGVVGLAIAVASALFLRELSPELREEVMVGAEDRILLEARARGIDVAASLRRPMRRMFKPEIVLSALAISVFLIVYYTAVGFFPVFFQTVFGYSQTRANGLGDWIWAVDAVALIIVGWLSDKVRVRKPFMVVGAVGAIVTTVLFAQRATRPETSYSTFVVILVLLALFLGVAYAPWMASFTETVERRNPALGATGFAVWGLTIRIVIAVSVFVVPLIVTTVSTLVEDGPLARSEAARYAGELATAQRLDPGTAAAVAADPADRRAGVRALSEVSGVPERDVLTVLAIRSTHRRSLVAARSLDAATRRALIASYGNPPPALVARAATQIARGTSMSDLQAKATLLDLGTIPKADLVIVSRDGRAVTAGRARLRALARVPRADLALLATVQRAEADSPSQWQHYFWIAVGGEVAFIPLIFLLAGAWSPRTARRREAEHAAWVETELARLGE